MDIVVTVSVAQKKALETEFEDVEQWLRMLTYRRADKLIDEIFQSEVKRLIENGEVISGTKDEIVLAAPVLSATEKNIQYIEQAKLA